LSYPLDDEPFFQLFIRKTGKHFVFQENEKFEYTFMLGIGYKKEYQKKSRKQLLNELFSPSQREKKKKFIWSFFDHFFLSFLREKISKKRVHNEFKS
jgi:hypothetical protein